MIFLENFKEIKVLKFFKNILGKQFKKVHGFENIYKINFMDLFLKTT